MSTDLEDKPTSDDPTAHAALEERSAAELEARAAQREAVLTRAVIPLLLPLGAIVGILVLVLNISRVLLAGGSTGALITASVITVGILLGAAAISYARNLRGATNTMLISALLIVVVGAGLTTLGASEGHEEGDEAAGGYQEPAGDPIFTLEVDALPTNKFQSDHFDVPAGIVEIKYVLVGGTHTLVFEEPEFSGFELAVPDGPDTGKVELAEGDYVIYCTIPGHRQAGMEASVTAAPGAAPASAEGEAPAGGEAPADATTTSTPAP